MAQSYPSNVPSCILKGSFIKVPVNSVLESSVVGLPQTRNRHTMELYNVKWQIRMSNYEKNQLLIWYHDTLKSVLGFNFTDPTTDEVNEYFFVSPPTHKHVGGDRFIVAYDLETDI